MAKRILTGGCLLLAAAWFAGSAPGCKTPGKAGEHGKKGASAKPTDDPDAPKRWIAALHRAKTVDGRSKALFQLYRIYEVTQARARTVSRYKKRLAAFRKLVNPALRKAFSTKVGGKYLAPAALLDKLVTFQDDSAEAAALFRKAITPYAQGKTGTYGDADLEESVVGSGLAGLAGQASRGHRSKAALSAIGQLSRAILKKGGAKKLDSRSFVRNYVVKAVGTYVEQPAYGKAAAAILAPLVLEGNRSRTGQDPMVTIMAMRMLGDAGDISPLSVQALVVSLLGKGRGRRFYSFAATALAKLPADSTGKHPALQPLLKMLAGDPWKRQIRLKQGKHADLKRQYRAKRTMPPCPYPKLAYVCRLFWHANQQEWDKTEPGVIPLNAMLTLRELGDVSAASAMLGQFGHAEVQSRWLNEMRSFPGMEDKRDRSIPGVQMQKMMIESYGKDMNLRSVMLHALGRMGATADPKVRAELMASLLWAGDPVMMTKAGEGLSLAPFHKPSLERLINQVSKAASFMMAVFKKRQVKMFFWGKAVKGTCPANRALEEKFKKCLYDPPAGATDANWACFEHYKVHWLSEFRYAIGYHRPGELKRYVQPLCKAKDRWWNKVRPKLLQQAGGTGPAAARAKRQLYACVKAPPKGSSQRRCGQWSVCDSTNNQLCLDGQWELRLRFHKHASLLAPQEYVDLLLSHTARTLMKPHNLSAAKLPNKDRSAFYDSDDALYLKSDPWDAELEKARRKKAGEVLELALCQNRQYLWVTKDCGADLAKYIAVVGQQRKVPTEQCRTGVLPTLAPDAERRMPTRRETPTWRARVKALRMLAHYGARLDRGSKLVQQAVQAAMQAYMGAATLPPKHMREIRQMALLVLDRLGDYAKQKSIRCTARMVGPAKRATEPLPLELLNHKLAIARAHKDKASEKKYRALIERANGKKTRTTRAGVLELECFRLLKRVIRSETQRRLKGAWQINRDARNALGRLARRAKVHYSSL